MDGRAESRLKEREHSVANRLWRSTLTGLDKVCNPPAATSE